MKNPHGVKRAVPPRLTRASPQADIDEEMRAHLEALTDELVAQGLSPEEAAREARRRFGDAEKLRAEIRDIDLPHERSLVRSTWLGSLGQDLSFWVRQMRRSPGLAAVTVLTLALGIGLTTSMFTVVRGVLLRPLAFPQSDRLVAVSVKSPSDESEQLYVRDAHYADIERGLSALGSVAAYMSYPPTTLTGAGDPARLTATWATPRFFETLGVTPMLGRTFGVSDRIEGEYSAVVLSDALWRMRFGADPAVIGRSATLDGIPRTIVGVMPPDLRFPVGSDLWLPLGAHPMRAEGLNFAYAVLGRLADGVSVEAAQAELATLARSAAWRIGRDEPIARVVGLHETIVGDSRYPLIVFSGAVALLLLIACTNVANLLLMRAASREHEIGLRLALGAGRARLLRQLLTESVLLACAGGALGIVVASAGVRALLALAPAGAIPRGEELGVDPVVLAFTLSVSVATGIAFGLAPAVKSTRRNLRDTLARGVRTHSRSGRLGRNALVVAELGLAVVLLTGAGLLLRSFQEIRSIELGFEPRGTLTFYVDLPGDAYERAETSIALHQRVLDGLTRLPGVDAAGGANFEPFGPLSMSTTVTTENVSDARTPTRWMVASPGYFEAMGIELIAGRAFEAADDRSAPGVVVVSRGLAQDLWPGEDALGQRLLWSERDWITVVGVVEDMVGGDVMEGRGPLMYRPLAQITNAQQLAHMSYVVRTTASAAAMAETMRNLVREADPNLPVGSITSLDQIVLGSLADRIFQTRVLGVFAALALLLAAIGVYGVTAYSVSERTHELGIRVAMGARNAQVAALALREALGLAVIGLSLGAVASVVATRVIAASLYEVTPSDPVTHGAVAALLAIVVLTAALVPARRASRVDPVRVLSA